MSGQNHANTPHGAVSTLGARKWTFLAVAIVVFGSTLLVLSGFDLLPNSPNEKLVHQQIPQSPTVAPIPTPVVDGELPTKISIPSINLSVTVANPSSTDAAVLDAELLHGAVRYPVSGTLGQVGKNVVVFGHSSYLPIVHNKAYKAFDEIQTLKAGDKITVTGEHTTYVYSVETVAQANTAKDGIPVEVTGSKLTLVTCDSFASKSDRFVVIASLVESYPNTN